MRGGAPPFELSDGVCRRETRAESIPHARRTPCTLSVRPRAPTKQLGPYRRPAQRYAGSLRPYFSIAWALCLNFCTFPDPVSGKLSTMSTYFGTL